MLIFLFFFFSISLSKTSIRNNKHFVTCNHDREILSEIRKSQPHKLRKSTREDDKDPSLIEKEVENRKPIRVQMRFDSLYNINIDECSCRTVGETRKYIYNNKDVCNVAECRQEDILTDKKRDIIVKTMENAQSYINKLVRVTQINSTNIIGENDFKGVGWKDHTPIEEDNDLFIIVCCRAYGETSDTLASARHINLMNKEDPEHPLNRDRPRIGVININVAKLPSSPQNYDSGDRQFFVTCMHELMHVLAFSSSLFEKWNNRTSGNKYVEEKFNFGFKNNYGVTQSFISSPKLTEWVHNRFQVANSELFRFGLEIEDGGGSGTAGSHPNSRLYFTDIMQGKTYGPGYFSPIFFHSLYDSGWYEPNYTMMEDLVYLNPRYVNEPISQYVLTEPPRESFPKEVFCYNNMQAYCYYDYSYKAVCDTKTYKEVMESDIKDFNNYKNNKNFTTWYGGPGNRYSDEENFDFMPVLFPSGDSNCRNPLAPEESEDVANMAKRMEETYSETSVCVLTTIWKQSLTQFSLQKNAGCYKARCGEDNKLRITLPNTPEQVCTRENQRIYKKGSTKYALCPRVEAACATLPYKSSMITVQSALPDRGPYNGQNYVLLQGFNLLSHGVKKIIFGVVKNKEARNVNKNEYTEIVSFSEERKDFIEFTDDHILIKMPDSLKVDKKNIGVPIDLIFESKDNVDVNFVENIYTFLKRDYSNPT